MKTILCFGDSNTWGCPPRRNFGNVQRYGDDVRWAGVLRTTLGPNFAIVEEGLNGRTTVWNDPVDGEHKNGKTYLTPCLDSHRPLDLVVLMLGTNDLKHRFGLSAPDIAAGVGALLGLIQSSGAGPDGGSPRVLVICPPPLGKLGLFAAMFEGAAEKSRHLAKHFKREADAHGCSFLDAGNLIHASPVDGIHLDADAQQALGQAVAKRVKALVPLTA